MIDEQDLLHLRRAIELARMARQRGNHPFGALIVAADGSIVAEAGNTVTTDGPTGHAELNAIRAVPGAAASLAAATLYASTEPCAMCAGATYWAGVGRVVYALGEDALRAMTGGRPGQPDPRPAQPRGLRPGPAPDDRGGSGAGGRGP